MEKDGNDPKEKRRKQNRLSYTRNRKAILKRAQERYLAKKIVSFPSLSGRINLPSHLSSEPRKRRSLIRWTAPRLSGWLLEHGLVLAVILLSTFFLLRETATFLSLTEGVSSAWLKALVGEGLVISLSAMRFTTWTEKSAKAALLLVLFLYNGFAIVGGIWTQGQSKMTQSAIARQSVIEIEAEIQKKETIRLTYAKAGADILARRYDRQVDALRDKLAIARTEMLKNPSAENVRTTFSVLAFFRLIVLVGNSFLVSQFSAVFRRDIAPIGRLRVC